MHSSVSLMQQICSCIHFFRWVESNFWTGNRSVWISEIKHVFRGQEIKFSERCVILWRLAVFRTWSNFGLPFWSVLSRKQKGLCLFLRIFQCACFRKTASRFVKEKTNFNSKSLFLTRTQPKCGETFSMSISFDSDSMLKCIHSHEGILYVPYIVHRPPSDFSLFTVVRNQVTSSRQKSAPREKIKRERTIKRWKDRWSVGVGTREISPAVDASGPQWGKSMGEMHCENAPKLGIESQLRHRRLKPIDCSNTALETGKHCRISTVKIGKCFLVDAFCYLALLWRVFAAVVSLHNHEPGQQLKRIKLQPETKSSGKWHSFETLPFTKGQSSTIAATFSA